MLVKGGQIGDDPFTQIADGEPAPDAPVIVSAKRFLAEREQLLARAHPLGVRLETAESPESLGGDVHKLATVLLHVHHFKDGRAFSWARLLRTRLGYKGEIRVTGHFLLDQIAFYTRVGADTFEITQNISPDAIRHALTEISDVYQPAADGRPTVRDLRAQARR